jgi:hypothetical protein
VLLVGSPAHERKLADGARCCQHSYFGSFVLPVPISTIRATERHLEIVYLLTQESWAFTASFVQDPNGMVLKIMTCVKYPAPAPIRRDPRHIGRDDPSRTTVRLWIR